MTRTIAVVGTARCNRFVRSGCKVVTSVPGPGGFQSVVVDPSTDTIYALFGGTTGAGHAVKLFNGARCNAQNTSGCHPVATVEVGQFPIGAALDPATHTLYVSNNYSGTVSMINTRACNAARTAGCVRRPPVARVGAGPNFSAIDQATHTLYVPNDGPGGSGGGLGSGGTTVSIINTATCNAAIQAGCQSSAPTATVGNTPIGVTTAASTVYAWNSGPGTASLINAATCNAVTQTSCHRAKATATVGAGAGPGGNNPRTRTVYAVNAMDDTMSVLNSATCNARHPAGCPATPPTLTTGAEPDSVLADPATDTLYVPNQIGSTVSVLNGAACNATNHDGCRRPAPSVPEHEYLLSADPATNTIYAGNLSLPQIDVINGATCHAGQLTGCAPVAAIPMPDPQANVGAIDDATHTLYASDEAPSGTIAVINTATCNATDTSGCNQHPPMIKIGAFPGSPALNPATHSVYVAYGSTGSKVAVINATTCNATDTSGCGQIPAVVKVGQGTAAVAVSVKTDTVYAPNSGPGFSGGNTVSVINGATCNGTNHTGCGRLAATAKVGPDPLGLAVNDRTSTVYVANNAGGDSTGTVSVINTATCNGSSTTGCHRHFPTVATGRTPFFIAVDPRTNTLYVSALNSAEVTILNGSRCNATVTSGCSAAGREQAVGSLPFALAINPYTHTVYLTQLFQAGSLTIFKTAQH